MVESGSENNNLIVDTYVESQPLLTKIRALHDFCFGNGQVEANNRIMKHN